MITGVILAHNEEIHIKDCVAALRPHVGEVILIDTESTDRTAEIARPLVDQTLSHPNVPNFDAVRNIAMPAGHFDWFWFVDADERIPELTGKLVNDLIRDRGHEFEAINIPFKSHFCGQWMQHCGWWPGYTVCRVLKRGHFEFGRILHSGVMLNGREIRFPPDPNLAVPHYSFRDLEHYVAKFNRYTSTEAGQLKERDCQYDWRAAVQGMVHDLWEHYELHNARRDGSLGWILTWMAGQYRWMSQSKLIDLQPRSDTPSAPENLDEFLQVMEQDLAMFRARRPKFPLGMVLRQASGPPASEGTTIIPLAIEFAGLDREICLDASALDINIATPADRRLMRALIHARRPKFSANVLIAGQSVPSLDPAAVLNLLIVGPTLRGPEVSSEWLARAKQFDEVWVSSSDQAADFRRRGIAPEKMRIAPAIIDGVDAADFVESAIIELETRLAPVPKPKAETDRIQVQWEGELFAGHSFANVNENLLHALLPHESLGISVGRVFHNSANDRLQPLAAELLPLVNRELAREPDVVVRHAFPPNWTKPVAGGWVHIQPWEFGRLPQDWLPHLRDHVDEIWAPSNYVRDVYIASGISPAKIQVIPWGVDLSIFNPDQPPLDLRTEKTFRLLFVGGTIYRKGIDRALAAFREEFGPADDVCLVVKDQGARSFYAHSPIRAQLLEAVQNLRDPKIVYIDEDYTAGQMASLYCACQCLVAPYRGEGFGLPMLESAACAVPAIVPRGGPTDDFLDEDTAYLLNSELVEEPGIPNLCGPATIFDISIGELRQAMRAAFDHRSETRQRGELASERVHRQFSWAATAELTAARIQALANRAKSKRPAVESWLPSDGPIRELTAVVWGSHDNRLLANSLGQISPFVRRVLVMDVGTTERGAAIVREYGAKIVAHASAVVEPECEEEWILHLHAGECVTERTIGELKRLIVEAAAKTMALRVTVGSANSVGQANGRELRVHRFDGRIAAPDWSALDEAIAKLDGEVHETNLEIHCSESNQSELLNGARRTDLIATNSADRQVDTSGRGVLIQLAAGRHRELLEITHSLHRAYAERHGLDYWCVEGNPAAPKRAGWAKIPLILSAMQMGFERIVWLDADAVVHDRRFDISRAVAKGIGMVQHPNPTHWNSGVMVVRNSPATRGFFEAVQAEPENDSAWMEQLPINLIAKRPEFAGLLSALDPAFNSTPGAVVSPRPVILAAHGLPHAERVALLTEWVAQSLLVGSTMRPPDGPTLSRREEFGELLNRLRLTGEAVEVGVLRGEFSRTLLDSWRGQTLHLVDPWRRLDGYRDIANLSDEDHERCLRDVEKRLTPHQGRFAIHRKLSLEAASDFADRSLDFVYVDANHERLAVASDLAVWFPKIRSGGVLAGHDYLDGVLPEGVFGVKTAVDEFSRENQLQLNVTHESAWPSWYFIKPPGESHK
jgi:glycosyltransferase involved in cell wall biosynthesis